MKMINESELIYKVNSLPLFDMKDLFIKKETEFKDIKKFKLIIEKENETPIVTVSPKYNLIQFKDIIIPLLKGLNREYNGDVIYNSGRCLTYVFPTTEDVKIDDTTTIGIQILNSVDKSSKVELTFCIRKNNYIVIIPKESFRKKHMGGNILSDTKYFSKAIISAKEIWKEMIQKFSSTYITKDNINDFENIFSNKVIEHINLKIRSGSLDNTNTITLWEAFTISVNHISRGKYKTELNRILKINELVEKLTDYIIIENI